jgi:hypothetical protein
VNAEHDAHVVSAVKLLEECLYVKVMGTASSMLEGAVPQVSGEVRSTELNGLHPAAAIPLPSRDTAEEQL